MLCCLAGSWQIRSEDSGMDNQLFLSWRDSHHNCCGGAGPPQQMGHFLCMSHSVHLTHWSPNQKKNYFGGKKVICLWPGEGAGLAHQVISSVLTLQNGEFRSLEGKNRKVVREEAGQPPSSQQALAMAQLPWKEATGWVASPD